MKKNKLIDLKKSRSEVKINRGLISNFDNNFIFKNNFWIK